jgi:hypothetical protein
MEKHSGRSLSSKPTYGGRRAREQDKIIARNGSPSISTQTKENIMEKKVRIRRRKPIVDAITAKPGDNVVWSIDLEEGTEFEILFPPARDPLLPGSNKSQGQILGRTINVKAPKGRYPYKVRLVRTNEDADGQGTGGRDLSGPEMVIE